MGLLDQLFHTYIGRVVAFVLVPVLTSLSITVVPWLNEVLGTDLTTDQVANAVLAVIVGQILLGWQWLRNRGNWEIADKVQSEIQSAYDLGSATVDEPVPDAPIK